MQDCLHNDLVNLWMTTLNPMVWILINRSNDYVIEQIYWQGNLALLKDYSLLNILSNYFKIVLFQKFFSTQEFLLNQQRRIMTQYIETKDPEKLCQKAIKNILKEHFIHEYYTPIPFQQILPHIIMKKHPQNDIIFDQGDPIDCYYFLVAGRVLLTKRHKSDEQQRNLVDGPVILGEYFQSHSLKRQKSARVLSPEADIISIDRDVFHRLLQEQQKQFRYIVNEISIFASVSIEALEKIKLFSWVHMEKYRLNELIKAKERTMYLIVDGQCKISNKKKEVVVSRFNCIALEKYFDEAAIEYTYTTYSTELLLIGIGYDIIEQMPQQFVNHISFIYQAHQLTLQPNNQLPRLERQSNKQTKSGFSSQDLQLRFNKATKSNSVMEMDEGTSASVNNFRKQYALGYYDKQIVISTLEFEKRKKLSGPKGYFQIKSSKLERQNLPQEWRRREWANYVQAKSEEKQKSHKKFKGNIKKSLQKENRCSPSKKEATFKEIFSKFNSFPSITSHKKSSLKLVKSGAKLRQFLFNGR